MSILKVGDICVWQNQAGAHAYLNGTECTSTAPLDMRLVRDAHGAVSLELVYGVDAQIPWFTEVYASPSELRLKDQPSPEAEQEYAALIERLTGRVMA
ncbi:hypothetical protein ACHMW6_06195 [Pseudoduganella sp. UC29_106]|uniref:hypothetical protein n=1 Tax=Pseudoduganella sp. UC29_106 TaxID=3374553 RepID=UPI003757ADD1